MLQYLGTGNHSQSLCLATIASYRLRIPSSQGSKVAAAGLFPAFAPPTWPAAMGTICKTRVSIEPWVNTAASPKTCSGTFTCLVRVLHSIFKAEYRAVMAFLRTWQRCSARSPIFSLGSAKTTSVSCICNIPTPLAWPTLPIMACTFSWWATALLPGSKISPLFPWYTTVARAASTCTSKTTASNMQ